MKTHQNDKLKALQKLTGGSISIIFNGDYFSINAPYCGLTESGKSIDDCCDKIFSYFRKECKRK